MFTYNIQPQQPTITPLLAVHLIKCTHTYQFQNKRYVYICYSKKYNCEAVSISLLAYNTRSKSTSDNVNNKIMFECNVLCCTIKLLLLKKIRLLCLLLSGSDQPVAREPHVAVTTDIVDAAQLIVFIRMVFQDGSFKEETLKIILLKDKAHGEDISQQFKICVKEMKLLSQKFFR